jgi:septum formation protein
MEQVSKKKRPLVLASASPRRRELLTELSLGFRVRSSDVPEEYEEGLSPDQVAIVLAARKSEAVARQEPDAVVLGADTIVVFDGHILGKPDDRSQARQMLRMLRGQWHAVITAVAVTDSATGNASIHSVTTRVKMVHFDDEALESYIATGEPMDKAGSYAVQGRGGELIEAVDGCYSNVVGLPLCETARLLTDFGVSITREPPVCRLPSGAPCPREKREENAGR